MPTGPNTVLSRMVINKRNSVAMMGKVRSKSNNLPASACAGDAATALTRATAAGTLVLANATARAPIEARCCGATVLVVVLLATGALAAEAVTVTRARTVDIVSVFVCVGRC